MDERVLERADAGRVILEAFGDHACAPGETLGWVCDQHGTLVAAVALTNHRLWWNALAAAGVTDSPGVPVAGILPSPGLRIRNPLWTNGSRPQAAATWSLSPLRARG